MSLFYLSNSLIEALAGLEADTWPRVQRLAMEVHGSSALRRLQTTLAPRASALWVEAQAQIPDHYMLYALAEQTAGQDPKLEPFATLRAAAEKRTFRSQNRLLDFLLERQRAAKAEALSEPFLLLLPSWTAGKAFFRKFLRALARLGEAPTSGRGREERGAGVFYVCRRSAEGKPEKYSFDHVAGAGRLTCPFFGIWICGGFGEAAATNRALKAAARGRAEGLWEGAWHSCRPLPPDNEKEAATTNVRWLEDETWSELPNEHLRGGLLLLRDGCALEAAGLLRTAAETKKRQDVGSLCLTVQQELGLSRIKVVTSRGTVLGGAATLQEAGIEDGEALAVVVKDIEIVGTYDGRAFAMIGRDGSVVTWGQDSLGGDSTEVQHQLRNVQQIKGTRGAFAATLEDGSVCTWGETRQDATFEAVCHELRDVRKLQASFGAFAAVRGDGTVVAWGSHSHGGRITGALKTKLQLVRDIEATGLAFAALCADGSVVAWGHEDSGGDSRAVGDRLQEVWKIRSTMHAFAAIRKDGTVVTWGRVDAGGDSSAVQTQLTGVREIASTGYAFAAIRDDGSVVTWGRRLSEHGGDSHKIQEHLVNVKHVQGSVSTFAAIVGDGSIVAWGDRRPVAESSTKNLRRT
eukprot:s2984_g2.t1